jgi:hypothetical protein
MTLVCELVQDAGRGMASPHRKWKVEYSSKPQGVGNPGGSPKGIYDRSEIADMGKKASATASPEENDGCFPPSQRTWDDTAEFVGTALSILLRHSHR